MGNGVTNIESFSFMGCSSLTSIIIPEGVTSIHDWTFIGCSSLTSITIPNGVTYIGNSSFYNCSGLTSVIIGYSVKYIGDAAFWNCHSLKSIIIPNSVTHIGESAFIRCTDLTSVTIPESVTKIGEGAFSGCSNLKSIAVEEGNEVYDSRDKCNAIIETATNTLHTGCMNTIIPESVTDIGNAAFLYCDSLKSITIPDGVTSIGEYAFSRCRNLKSVTIGSGMTSLGEYAFRGCGSLEEIHCYAVDPPDVSENTFEEVEASEVKLFVPSRSNRKYKEHPIWGLFHILDVGTGIDEIGQQTTVNRQRTIYNLAGQRLSKPQKGLNIRNGKIVLIK